MGFNFKPFLTMSFIHVHYDSIEHLIKQFQDMNIYGYSCTPDNANFVLINPKYYYGSYGGLLLNCIIQKCSEKECFSELISNDLSIVWWNSPHPKHVGEQNVLSVGERVAVTPSIFKQLLINPMRKRITGKSSYYGDKAWSIKSRSSAYSDSV